MLANVRMRTHGRYHTIAALALGLVGPAAFAAAVGATGDPGAWADDFALASANSTPLAIEVHENFLIVA